MIRKKKRAKSIIIKTAADLFTPLAITYGCYVVFHGNSSPGGGFQGGVLIASIVILVYLGYGLKGVRKRFNTHALHSSETISELVYVATALMGVLLGTNFCVNYIFGGKVTESTLLMNHAVGYHVMAGISFLLVLMLSLLENEDTSFIPGEEDEA